MANQFTSDDILYQTPLRQGVPITELRKTGKMVVLYTEDNAVLRRFSLWKHVHHTVPYYQNAFFGKRRLIAADIWFPKSASKQLVRALSDGKIRTLRKPAPVT